MGTPKRAAPDVYYSDDDGDDAEWRRELAMNEAEFKREEQERKRDLAEMRAHYGERDHEPAGYLDEDLYASCCKFFDHNFWRQLQEGWSPERYQGFFSEEGLRDCHNAYARFLLRGFKGVPGWDADDERVSKTPEDEAESAHAYQIWGIDETDDDDLFWEPREAPIEGRAGMALRSGKRTRPHAHSTPSYPEIRKHQLGDWMGMYMYPRPAVPEE